MKTKFYSFLIFILTLSLATVSHSQTFEENTIRFPMLHEYDGNYHINPMGDQGLIVLRNRYGGEEKDIISELEVTYIKSNFQKKWVKNISLTHYGDFISEDFDDKYAYYLMRSSKRNYQVLRIHLEDGSHKIFFYRNVEKMTIDYFEIEDNICFLGGAADARPFVSRWELESGKRTILPSINQLNGGVVCMKWDHKVDLLTVVIKAEMSSEHRGVYINDYTVEGRLDKQYFEEAQRDYNYQTFRPYHNSKGELMIIGTYGLGSYEEDVQGVYTMAVGRNSYRLRPKFYDFLFFNNFNSHLSEKEQEHIKEKFKNKRERNKVIPQHLTLQEHELQFMNGQVVFVMEEMEYTYPFTSDAKYTTESFFSRADVPTPKRFLQNYENQIMKKGEYIPYALNVDKLKGGNPFPLECRYKRVIACGFDPETGKMQWDNTYMARSLKNNLPVESVQAYADHKKVAFLHVSRDSFFYKISNRLEYENGCKVVVYKDYSPANNVEKYINGGVSHWYENHFIHTGTKKITSSINHNETQQYFFLTCLSYSNRQYTK
ncbi:hypothetical protein [Flammeovirga sp. OC4]|uniref:hypothetical protein n=1 Tax=Flammeovirga sp. OC4 TaxID=1382345 RepID=UPI0012E09180|nr:hypothetical protein [Flammeovirga sp. OC4]